MTQGHLSELDVPDGWSWERAWIAMPRVQVVGQPDAEPLSVFLGAGVVPRSSRADNHNQLGEDLAKYQVVQPGDVVFNKLRTWQGGLGVSNDHGIVSPAYFVCRPRADWHPRYLHYLLLSSRYLAELTRISKFMPPSQFDIPWDQLRTLPLLRPPVDEQRRIANFLDAETAQIDQIQVQRGAQLTKVAERLKAQIGTLFAESESGTVTRIKYLLASRPRYGVLVPELVSDGVPFIRVNNLLGLSGGTEGLARIPEELSAKYPTTVTRPGDLLLSVVGTLGRTAVVKGDVAGSNVARAVSVLRPLSGNAPDLLAAWMGTAYFEEQAQRATGTDTAQPTLGMEDLSNFTIRWPADQDERGALLRLAAKAQAHATELTGALNRQANLLAERRRALITAAVTGQIDVTTACGFDPSGGGV